MNRFSKYCRYLQHFSRGRNWKWARWEEGHKQGAGDHHTNHWQYWCWEGKHSKLCFLLSFPFQYFVVAKRPKHNCTWWKVDYMYMHYCSKRHMFLGKKYGYRPKHTYIHSFNCSGPQIWSSVSWLPPPVPQCLARMVSLPFHEFSISLAWTEK